MSKNKNPNIYPAKRNFHIGLRGNVERPDTVSLFDYDHPSRWVYYTLGMEIVKCHFSYIPPVVTHTYHHLCGKCTSVARRSKTSLYQHFAHQSSITEHGSGFDNYTIEYFRQNELQLISCKHLQEK